MSKMIERSTPSLIGGAINDIGNHKLNLSLRAADIAAVVEGGPIGAGVASAHADIYRDLK